METSTDKIKSYVELYETLWEFPLEEVWLLTGAVAAYSTSGVALAVFKVLSAICVGDAVADLVLSADHSWSPVLSVLVLGMAHTFPCGFVLMCAYGARIACGILKKEAHSLSNHPKEHLDDVVPLGKAKEKIAELVAYLHNPEPFLRLGAKPPRGILLEGPPGTGKTLLAKALSNEMGPYTSFIQTTGSQLKSKWVGESAEKVRDLFNEAKENAIREQIRLEEDAVDNPALSNFRGYCVIFIDEIDSFGSRDGFGVGNQTAHQDRVDTINELLAQMDGFTPSDSVLVIGTTNDADRLDPALLSRLSCRITTELPNSKERAEIFAKHLRGVVVKGKIDFDQLAARTSGFSGRDIKNVVESALWNAAVRGAHGVDNREFISAIDEFAKTKTFTLDILDKGLDLS